MVMSESKDILPPITPQEGTPVAQNPNHRGGPWKRVMKRAAAVVAALSLGLGGAGAAVTKGYDGPPLPTPTVRDSGEEPPRSDTGAHVRDAINAHNATSGGEQTAKPAH